MLASLLAGASWALLSQTAHATGATVRISVASDGTQGNASTEDDRWTNQRRTSHDGRFVVFTSYADNLVPGDTNGSADIFVRDMLTGQTTRVSVASDGSQADGDSGLPCLSGDGRWVAFASSASNLVEGDTNGLTDVFVHDRQTGTTSRVSVHSSGQQAARGNSGVSSISDDGRYVAFKSDANNLIGSDLDLDGECERSEGCDTNNRADVFVHDRQTHQTTRVSVGPGGAENGAPSAAPSISADGRYVAFEAVNSALVPGSPSTGYYGIFLRDLVAGQTHLIAQGNDGSQQATLSADGRFVAFFSAATDLVASDANATHWDVFVHDRQTGQTTLESVSTGGSQGWYNSFCPSISADGRYLSFTSDAANLVDWPEYDGNVLRDVYWRDRQTRVTRRISKSPGGADTNGESSWNSISGNGRYVLYASEASNLVADDTNGVADNFLYDRLGLPYLLLEAGAGNPAGELVLVAPSPAKQVLVAVFDLAVGLGWGPESVKVTSLALEFVTDKVYPGVVGQVDLYRLDSAQPGAEPVRIGRLSGADRMVFAGLDEVLAPGDRRRYQVRYEIELQDPSGVTYGARMRPEEVTAEVVASGQAVPAMGAAVTGYIVRKGSTVSLAAFPEGAGTVRVEPEQEWYSYGERITLSATAAEGYRFVEFVCPSGSVLGYDSPVTIPVDWARTRIRSSRRSSYRRGAGRRVRPAGRTSRWRTR